DHMITSYGGSHVVGFSPQGQTIIQLFPFDDTSNPGGVYILVVCEVGATNASGCKHDEFKVDRPPPPPPPPTCGDWKLDQGEQCDDGNTTSGDGCSSTCQIETPPPPPPPPRCGDWHLGA